MAEPKENKLVETASSKFVEAVEKHFIAEMGTAIAFTEYEKTLAQHMFLKVDAALKASEARRGQNQKPYTWENVNLPKLALDAVHRIGLGLDALVPNHIHPIAYMNNKLQKYDIDLRIGYVGKDYCRRKLAVEEPVGVIYHLVHETDKFKPIMKSLSNEVESYEFEITNPFDRGKVVGGFGYIMYDDPKKNKLVLVTKRDFEKAEAAAKTKDFWDEKKWREEMMFKTIVHRVADKLPLDPRKVNAKSYAYVEAQEDEGSVQREIDENANGQVIDIKGAVISDDEEGRQPEKEPENGHSKEQPAQQAEGAEQYAPTGTGGPGF